MFEDNEMCDGRCCHDKENCARWMMRCDWHKCNKYVVFNIRPHPNKCPHFLSIPHDGYPAGDFINNNTL